MVSRSLHEALRLAGYDVERLPATLAAGKFYRIPAPGRGKSDRNGWVTLLADGVAAFGDWATGEKHTWRRDGGNAPYRPANDSSDRRRAAVAQRKASERARAEHYAAILWERAASDATDHPYLVRKRVASHGLRIDGSERLLVPVYHAKTGEIINLQRINADGEKKFLKDAGTTGGQFTIPGELPRIFCEGYATGATIHAATGRCVVICFNSGNLRNVTAIMAQPGDVIGADNDNAPKRGERFGKRLSAYGAGHRAAMETGLPWHMPHTPGQDWNDAGQAATAAAFAGSPTSEAPIFNAWNLPRIQLSGTTRQQWEAQLSASTDPREAAAIALAVAGRMFLNAPAQTNLAGIRAFIESALTARLVHPATLDRIMGRLDAAMSYRQAAALAPVTIPQAILARHRHAVYDALPKLAPADYSGVIVLWAPMASGKTRDVGAPFVKWAGQHSKPLAICHRVSLVHDMARALGIEHYGEIDAATAHDPSLRGLATCLPSITSAAHAPLIEQAEYLFIDEISQVLRFLAARDHCRTREANSDGVYRRLRDLVARAKCVIVADAGCDARTVEFLESCRPGETFRVIEMQQRREGIEATYYTKGQPPAAVVGECLEELAAGGRAWIATESSRRARALGAYFEGQGHRVMALTADNKGNAEQAAFLAAPEINSRLYDVVIASPVIGSGLSIEHRDGEHFTLGAYIGGGHRVTPADAAQALRRVRYLRRFTLALMPNSQVGKQSPDGIIAALEAAAALEGRPAFPTDFTRLVAEINAAESNAKADFAAGLLWQLERAGWALYRGESSDAKIASELSAVKKTQEAAHRAALLSAPLIDDAEAKRLEAKPARNDLQNITLEAWRIRQSLGIDVLDGEALDFWDDGTAVRRLDRFSAWRGIVGAFDDSGDDLARRRYRKATAKAYAELFAGIDLVEARITEEVAETILDRMLARRHLLAHLGIAPKTYAIWMEDRDGNPLEPKRPKNARQELAEVLHRMGLEWMRREGKSTPTLAQSPLENKAQGGGKSGRTRFYQVTPESLAHMQRWADRRNANRTTATVRPVSFGEADAEFWRGVRRSVEARARIDMTPLQAANYWKAQVEARGLTYGARVTAFWLREVLPDRIAA